MNESSVNKEKLKNTNSSNCFRQQIDFSRQSVKLGVKLKN